MSTLLAPSQAREVIQREVTKRQDTFFPNRGETGPVPDSVIEALTDMLAKAFLVDIFTVPRESGKPQYRANVIRLNARFNVRETGEVTEAYLMRQLDRYEQRKF